MPNANFSFSDDLVMQGEIVVNRRVDAKTYTSLHALVNGMFPPTTSTSSREQVLFLQQFSVFNLLLFGHANKLFKYLNSEESLLTVISFPCCRRISIRGISGDSHHQMSVEVFLAVFGPF